MGLDVASPQLNGGDAIWISAFLQVGSGSKCVRRFRNACGRCGIRTDDLQGVGAPALRQRLGVLAECAQVRTRLCRVEPENAGHRTFPLTLILFNSGVCLMLLWRRRRLRRLRARRDTPLVRLPKRSASLPEFGVASVINPRTSREYRREADSWLSRAHLELKTASSTVWRPVPSLSGLAQGLRRGRPIHPCCGQAI